MLNPQQWALVRASRTGLVGALNNLAEFFDPGVRRAATDYLTQLEDLLGYDADLMRDVRREQRAEHVREAVPARIASDVTGGGR